MRRTSTSSYDLEYIRSLLVSDTLSFISGTLSVRHEHVFCPVLYEIISDLEHYISSDLIQTLSPLFLRFLGDVVHRYPRVIRSHLKSAEECFLKGMNVVYSFGEFNDNGFSGKTHLARFHYLNGDYSKVLDLFPNFENEICLNPFIDLSILFVVDDLSRTWRDTFLCDLIKMFAYDEGSIAMPVRCIAMSLYMICNCLQMLSSTGITIQKRTTRRLLKDSRIYDKKLKSVFITDIDATLKIVKQSKYILLKL
ncbi:unnamed protein product [Mytilus coruscus]|uniref:Uncharacterized protein n=1 Tax=Mytilus coruscus TaxID=42192 RepID=A0A6J8ES88_MYTCO|nr:unnamed protein product [Mytilus coruscus]